MKSFMRSFIISLALFGSCFASLEKISHDSLENCLRMLKPKHIAKIQSTCKDFKTVSERVYRYVPLETVHNIMQEKDGHDILKLYNHAKNLERNESFQRTSETNETIEKAYTLAIVTQNKKVKNKLSTEYKNGLRQMCEQEEWEQEYFFHEIFQWAKKHSFLQSSNQAKEVVSVFLPFEETTRGWFLIEAALSGLENILKQMLDSPDFMYQISPLNRGFALWNAATSCPENIVKQMLDSPDYMNQISADDRGQAFYEAAKSGLENIVKQMLDTPKFMEEIDNDDRGQALYRAAKSGLERIVKQMLDSPDYMYQISPLNRGLALWNAATSCPENIVKQMLDSLDFMKEIDNTFRGRTLRCTAIRGFESILKQMLDSPDYINQIGGFSKGRALYEAAEKGLENIVKQMLDTPKFINGIDTFYENEAIKKAAGKNNINIVKLLLNRSIFLSTKQLKIALRNTTDQEIKKLIQEKLKAYLITWRLL